MNTLRPLGVLACCVGVLLAVIMLLTPLDATFGDDPILRLRQLDAGGQIGAPKADCGPVPQALTRRTGGSDFYFTARDHACRDAGYRRLVLAMGTGLASVVGGLLAVYVARGSGSSRYDYFASARHAFGTAGDSPPDRLPAVDAQSDTSEADSPADASEAPALSRVATDRWPPGPERG